jgi:hypothetical protein
MSAQGVPLARGYKLGRYEVIGRISVGGMAELYLAFLTGQGGFRKFVALKRVLPSVMQQESFSTMMEFVAGQNLRPRERACTHCRTSSDRLASWRGPSSPPR